MANHLAFGRVPVRYFQTYVEPLCLALGWERKRAAAFTAGRVWDVGKIALGPLRVIVLLDVNRADHEPLGAEFTKVWDDNTDILYRP